MIVHYLNVVRLAVSPDEANSPLVVDSNTVLPGPISLEGFEAVARGNPKFLQPFGGVEVEESAPGHPFDRPEPEHGPILEERLAVTASKRPNQDPVYDVTGIPSIGMAYVGMAYVLWARAKSNGVSTASQR